MPEGEVGIVLRHGSSSADLEKCRRALDVAERASARLLKRFARASTCVINPVALPPRPCSGWTEDARASGCRGRPTEPKALMERTAGVATRNG